MFHPDYYGPTSVFGGFAALLLVNFLVGVAVAYFVYSHALNKSGNRDNALAWGFATFVFGLLAVVAYFVLQSNVPAKQVSCPSCGRENIATAVACQYCGTRFATALPRDKHCPECHRRFPTDANFCPHCGVALQEEVTSQRPTGAVTKVCPACQAVNLAQREQCHQCGHSFESVN